MKLLNTPFRYIFCHQVSAAEQDRQDRPEGKVPPEEREPLDARVCQAGMAKMEGLERRVSTT